MTCNCETTGGPCSKVSTCRMDAAVADVVEERDALAARLAEAEATASTANHWHELCYKALLSAEARLAEAERLLTSAIALDSGAEARAKWLRQYEDYFGTTDSASVSHKGES